MPFPDDELPDSSTLDEARASLGGARDALRSARRWRELLTEDDRRRLLADIAAVALAVGRDLHPDRALSDLDVGDGEGTPAAVPCPRERLAFLEALWPRLSAALRRIEAAPPRALRAETRVVPAERARRVSPAALLAAVRAGNLVPAPSAGVVAAPCLGGRLPRRLAETVLVTVRDAPEDRAVKTALAVWARDLAAVAALADVCGEAGVASSARRLRSRLRGAHLSRDPWRAVAPLPAMPSAAPPLALLRDPAYRVVWDAWRRYRRGFALDWGAPLFTLPARETWRLYECWCLFAAVRALRDLGWRCASADGWALVRSGLTFTVAPGASSRLTFRDGAGRRLTLTYARRFPRADSSDAATAGWHSRSHALVPDLTVEHDGRLLVLDAKFKTYAEPGWELDDVRQMHGYRDALRRGAAANVVDAAWLAFCGRADRTPAPAIIAYPASTAARPFGNGDVGALPLRPGADHAALRALLAGFLARGGT